MIDLEPWWGTDRDRAALADNVREICHNVMTRRSETEAGVPDMQSQYRAAVYGEQLWNYFSRSYPENVERHYPERGSLGS